MFPLLLPNRDVEQPLKIYIIDNAMENEIFENIISSLFLMKITSLLKKINEHIFVNTPFYKDKLINKKNLIKKHAIMTKIVHL
ncbi:protein of unknown function [Bartonella clarridgeiae 73]|uniref:Uncharacterized protein n=1 Tax=Bartonella clarridgeiae (strain CCUG 45776 / CIP 104772 / 73) TaxID=696125 RepID=E6YJL8_BARC7|nr:protein of unknown function [Bartonella clarridgeiae 73]